MAKAKKFFQIVICASLILSTSFVHAENKRFYGRGILDDIKDSVLPRKPVDIKSLGINAFVNDSQFGSIKNQYLEVKNTLGIKQVRVLLAWDDGAQRTPHGPYDFSFYDKIISNIPSGVQAFAVITGVPSWMKNSANWIDGNPRKTFVEKWVKVVAERYKSNSRLIGLQLWNEPNMTSNPHNVLLNMASSPENYVELLREGYQAVKNIAPRMLVLNAATTSIIQNYPSSLNYNRKMKAAGAEEYVDVWAAHFYGKSIENIIRSGGVASFFRTSKKPIWITESGAKGINNQREYVERYWTYLRKNVKKITRMYFYQFTENSNAKSTYGLRNPTRGKSISDFYIYLRDRKK